MFGVTANFFAMMPAAYAFGMFAGSGLDDDIVTRFESSGLGLYPGQGCKPGLGSNQYKAQFITDDLQLVKQGLIGVNGDLGIEARADFSVLAQGFQIFANLYAHLFEQIPDPDIDRFIFVAKQTLVPLGGEHTQVFAVPGHVFPDLVRGKTEDWSNPARHRFVNVKHRGLA